MKCQFCDNPATVHLTNISKGNKRKQEVHLCEECARKHNLIPDQPNPQVDLKSLLSLLTESFAPETASISDPAALTCPTCGLQYGEFRAQGRLGCPDDYDAFRPALESLLERIHRAQTHTGKIPRTVRRQMHKAELADLRERMTAAAAAERYEEAARIRDLIRQKEAE